MMRNFSFFLKVVLAVSIFAFNLHGEDVKLRDFTIALETIFKNEKVTFIQIGSNDGVLGDPIFPLIKKYGWSGVLVEPVPHIFENLKINYNNISQVDFENSAISDKKGILDFYVIDSNSEWYKTKAPIYADLLGSFYPRHIFNHFGPDAPVICLQIPCITLNDLLDKHQMTNVDLIHIDAEGHDTTIVLSIDFDVIKPKAILFEYGHVNNDREKFNRCIEYLNDNGYELYLKNSADMLWVRVE